jgi:hypothetical protein
MILFPPVRGGSSDITAHFAAEPCVTRKSHTGLHTVLSPRDLLDTAVSRTDRACSADLAGLTSVVAI